LFLSPSLAPLASAQNQVILTSAAGYYGRTPSGYLTAATADVLIPTVTCEPSLPIPQDLEIGLPLSNTTERIGPHMAILYVDIFCPKGSSTPNYSAYFSYIVGSLWFSHPLALIFGSGDLMEFAVTIDRAADRVTMFLLDLSSGEGVGYSAVPALNPIGWATTLNNVGWEVTTAVTYGQVALARFSTIAFTKVTFSTSSGRPLDSRSPAQVCRPTDTGCQGGPSPLSDLSSLRELVLVDRDYNVMATPSPLITSESFTVTFVAST